LRLARVRGVPGGAVCGPRPEARPLGYSSAFSLSAHRAETPDCCDNGTRKPRAVGSELRRMLGGDEAVGRDVISWRREPRVRRFNLWARTSARRRAASGF